MIRENQKLLNRINVFSDGVIVFCSFLLGYFVRFYLIPGGRKTVSFRAYILAALILAVVQIITFTIIGMYESRRKRRLYQEVGSIFLANVIDLVLLMMGLFLFKSVHFARLALFSFFVIETVLLSVKRIVVYKTLKNARAMGFNQKSIIILGSGNVAKLCVHEINRTPELGYQIVGYISSHPDWEELEFLGEFSALSSLLEYINPDEVIAGLNADEYDEIPRIIKACEKNGIKLSLIPYYVQYMPAHPQFDSLNGIPMLNLRRIPLDNIGNAFLKRMMDLIGSLVLIILSSPLMLIAVIGVRLSSPGPIIFRQERVGLNQKTFYMYKFRSMRVNVESDTAWSKNVDPRKTRFGAFIRKFSIDELPQFFNVLKGEMSLVGPRPEIPHFVEQFREEIPMYMVKHQVKPGITGWAQVHGLRGDTSIEERIRHDVFYIENWSFWLDVKILLMTVGKIRNKERLK